MLLQDFHDLLAYPCLTKVSWAQFLDSGQDNYSGMVSFEGRRKAVFNAYNVYMGMPVDRRRVSVSGSQEVGGMAATDGHRADLVLWNRSDDDQTVSVDLSHAPSPPRPSVSIGSTRSTPVGATTRARGTRAS
jgi:hypothetical protein